MNKQQLIFRGKRIFNFHPEEDFPDLGSLLVIAEDTALSPRNFQAQLALFAKDLAEYIDEVE